LLGKGFRPWKEHYGRKQQHIIRVIAIIFLIKAKEENEEEEEKGERRKENLDKFFGVKDLLGHGLEVVEDRG
jgi:hypothetical protein